MQITYISWIICSVSAVSVKCLKYHKRDCREFNLVKVYSDNVENTMIVGNATNVPQGLSDFHGLWYMDGNDMPDEVMSFGASIWNAKDQNWSLKVYDNRIWSVSPNLKGRALYHAARLNGFTYQISKYNSTAFQLQPTYYLPALLFSAKVPISRYISKFLLVQTQDPDIWISTGSWFGTKGRSYSMTRIVDHEGKRTAKYNSAYLQNFKRLGLFRGKEEQNKQLIAVLKTDDKIINQADLLSHDSYEKYIKYESDDDSFDLESITRPPPMRTGAFNDMPFGRQSFFELE